MPRGVENKPEMAGQRGPTGWLAETGRGSGQPEAWSGGERSLKRASWLKAEQLWFRHRYLGRCRNLPHYSFGFEKQHTASTRNTCDPGPVYDVPQSATRCGNVVRATYSFGTGPQRGQAARSERVPGPGHYRVQAALGPQIQAGYKSGMVVGFGVPSAQGTTGRPIATTEGQHTPHGQDKTPYSPRPPSAPEAHLLAQGCPLGPRGGEPPPPGAKERLGRRSEACPAQSRRHFSPWTVQSLAGSKVLARLLARQAEPVGPAHPAGDEIPQRAALHDSGAGRRRHAGAGTLCRLRACRSAASLLEGKAPRAACRVRVTLALVLSVEAHMVRGDGEGTPQPLKGTGT